MKRPLSDAGAAALAVAAAGGAWWAHPFPLWPLVAAAAVTVALRRPWLLVLAAGLLASSLGARATAGLAAPPPAPVSATVRLLTDAQPAFGGVAAEARLGQRHVSVYATGSAASELRDGLAGQRYRIEGHLTSLPPSLAYLHARHVVARVQASHAAFVDDGGPLWRLANRARGLVEGAVAGLPAQQRALFDGFVLGDSRGQDANLAADFQGAGLTHLLVVSGENVAFVLALAGPLLRRLRLRGRWVATVALIAFFAAMTRFEPSVLRASVMAGLAATATFAGRPASAVRLLSLAVAALVLADPLLVHSVGFLLSVGATAAIVVAARPLAAALPGPAALRAGAAVTITAELGIAPVAVVVFGGVPVASLPANLLAVPAAGLVVVWGLPLGLGGSLLRATGAPGAAGLARALLVPAGLLLRWVAAVARRSAALPLGDLHAPELALLTAGVAGLVAGARFACPVLRLAGLALAVLALVLPGIAFRVGVPLHARVADGVELWRSGGATVVELARPVSATAALDGLRRAGVRRIDLVIAGTGGAHDAAVVDALRHRWPVGEVLAPSAARIRGARVPSAGARWQLGGLALTVTEVQAHLRVTVAPAPDGGREAPV